MHELTSRALKFVTELLAYSDAAGTTLRTDLGSAQTGLSWLGGEGARTLIADWLHGGKRGAWPGCGWPRRAWRPLFLLLNTVPMQS